MNRSQTDAPAMTPRSSTLHSERWAVDPGAAATWEAFIPGTVAPNDADACEQTEWLERTIEAEIIPRLLLAHRTVDAPPLAQPPSKAPEPTADDVLQLAELVLRSEAGVAVGFVAERHAAGIPLERIYLDLLAPAARHLGALWEADLCHFAEVTLGLWRLQQVMHGMGASLQDGATDRPHARRTILVPVPGSQHTLGLFMVAEFFRRAGWDVWGDAMVSLRDIVAAVRTEWFDCIGISIGTETQFDALALLIARVRKASKNRRLVVIIGGPIVSATPGLVAQVGADATAEDAPRAVVQAEVLVAQCSSATQQRARA